MTPIILSLLRRRHQLLIPVALCCLASGMNIPRAQASEGKWKCPLYEKTDDEDSFETSWPRQSVWNISGELQIFGSAYLHPGMDIRGAEGDIFVMPTRSNLAHCYIHHDTCGMDSGGKFFGTSCRLWFRTKGDAEKDPHVLFYVSHVNLARVPVAGKIIQTTEMREQVDDGCNGADLNNEKVPYEQGDPVAKLAGFPKRMHHLHFGVFDPAKDYAMVSPFEFLEVEAEATGSNGEHAPVSDTERPAVNEIQIVEDKTSKSVKIGEQVQSVSCSELASTIPEHGFYRVSWRVETGIASNSTTSRCADISV